MPILLNNKILQAAEQAVEAKLTPENRDDYMKIVVAGGSTWTHDGGKAAIARLRESKDPIATCALGAINTVVLMAPHAKGKMPVKAAIPAAMTLMLQALDFANRAGIVQVGDDELNRAAKVFTDHLAAVKIIPPLSALNKMAARTHAIMQDPGKMEIINRRAGLVKDPRASSPTPLPEEKDMANGNP